MLPREDCVAGIRTVLAREMNSPEVSVAPYERLLEILATRTADGWSHRFLTTNWDYLLQRTITRLDLKRQPSWLDNSHVLHLNGTVEVLIDNSQRSAFILESDEGAAREPSHEFDAALHEMAWDCHFVVVGMSFECQGDKYILRWLSCIEDDLPVGQSTWLVLNPDPIALAASLNGIQSALPRACVRGSTLTLEDWIASGLDPLAQFGVLTK